jgi:hypothetical protein
MPIPIEYLTTFGKTVYYPYLGYMDPTYWRSGFITPTEIEKIVREHVTRLRLFCLYFHYILIPFSHLTTFPELWAQYISNQLLSHHDFRVLSDSGVIYAGTWGGRTKDTVLEEHGRFLQTIKWPVLTNLKREALAGLKSTELTTRDVTKQSRGLREDLLEYLACFKSRSNAVIAKQIQEIALRAEYQDRVPFVHESFILQLHRSDIPYEYVSKALCATNILYFTAGEIGNPGTIVPYVKKAEGGGISRKSITSGLHSLVYNDVVFESFLNVFLEPFEISKLKYHMPIERLLKLRDSAWEVFMSRYHKFLEDLSDLIGYIEINKVTQQMLEETIKDNLKIIGDHHIQGMLQLLDVLLFIAISCLFKSPPQQTSFADAIYILFKEKIKRLITRFQHREYAEFMLRLRKELPK